MHLSRLQNLIHIPPLPSSRKCPVSLGIRQLHSITIQDDPSKIQRLTGGRQLHGDEKTAPRPLSLLPTSTLIRSYAITASSSYPFLLTPSLRLLSWVAHSSSPILNPDRNPLLHFLLKKTLYVQFCAGETFHEVQITVQSLKSMGFRGVILAYGREIVLSKGEKAEIAHSTTAQYNGTKREGRIETPTVAGEDLGKVKEWREGTLKTVGMTSAGDYVALKFSGAGEDAMRQLAAKSAPSPAMEEATRQICDVAQSRGVRLLFDAEQHLVQEGIDQWTLAFQRRYNREGHALVYGTYQAYLRSAPDTLAKHLAIAKRDGFVLGVKLVRGAYMASDPRECFWSSKDETDVAYDGIMESLLRRQWNDVLQPTPESDPKGFPGVDLVLASHNQESVSKAMAIRKRQTEMGQEKIEMAYGQLMGMADEVSCDLVMACKKNESAREASGQDLADVGPKAYKYLVWGSVGECLKYLVRRAEENRDAVLRARGSRFALGMELKRRMWG
ncbi:MAG: proline dehydrogenase [Ramalina farinacea]|uniref:Proline dehydrogenase n=1 Tax=Ramalina farinacea TaxID=258253 RepID=A0AA43QQE6_9LECA|nr:proline dehydrogenase [Ramalina farinacea]